MQACLPEEKLNCICQIISEFQSVRSLSKCDMFSLLGHFSFTIRIIPHGCAFISRLLDLSKTVLHLNYLITLDKGCFSELCSWTRLLNEWNEISFFYNGTFETSSSIQYFTDAAPSIGFGGLFGNKWFTHKWQIQILNLPSDQKSTVLFEIYPIAISCLLWGNKWSRKRSVFCDNQAAVEIINKGH